MNEMSWQDRLREFLEECQVEYGSVGNLFGNLEELPEGTYMTAQGPVEVSRTVH